MSPTCRDTWKWNLSDDGDFTVKELTAIIQDQSTTERQSNHETIWIRLVPRKINVFAWRATKGRLSVRVELEKCGIDLNTMLCPRCDDQIETVDHGLVLCKEVMKLWEKIYIWGGDLEWLISSVRKTFFSIPTSHQWPLTISTPYLVVDGLVVSISSIVVVVTSNMMIPDKTKREAAALARLKVYEGVPTLLKNIFITII
nr:RNA-directed DNA polymerase, eukaryota, reverse transcriptase zinc-binding domain protein [Tanacetum cinerariifolium]